MRKFIIFGDKIIPRIMLLFLIAIVTAAAYQGFFTKWHFLDLGPRNGIERIYDGTAHKPFIHRQLLPVTTKILVEKMPENIKHKLENSHFIENNYANVHIPSAYHAEYVLLYILCYLSFCVSAFILAIILSELTGKRIVGVLTSFLFILLFPLFETNGGYYYDFFELMFFAMAIYLAMHGKWIALLLMTAVAEMNKESFLYFIPLLYPFLKEKFSRRKSFLVVTVGGIVASFIYLWIKLLYATNSGGIVEFHLLEHFRELLNWHSYVIREENYGIVTGGRMFFLYIIMVGYIIWKTWGKLPAVWKLHGKLALIIQLPLYFLFCVPGELRNLSLLYMTFCAMLSVYIDGLLKAEK